MCYVWTFAGLVREQEKQMNLEYKEYVDEDDESRAQDHERSAFALFIVDSPEEWCQKHGAERKHGRNNARKAF